MKKNNKKAIKPGQQFLDAIRNDLEFLTDCEVKHEVKNGDVSKIEIKAVSPCSLFKFDQKVNLKDPRTIVYSFHLCLQAFIKKAKRGAEVNVDHQLSGD